ncbi:peptide deformylase [Candidatus Peregrinibacteria bacterium]|nr:peptide deformylase [Candidatus Peregrinibacteria bacterium]
MPVLPIVTGKDTPVLRKKTKPVPKVTKEVLKLIKDLRSTVKKAEGLGIAAPQVGVSLRVCLANINGKMTPLINPDITWKSEETMMMQEGCLSLPGVDVDVRRAVEIAVVYLDEKGKEQERRLHDLDARVVQHETDHLDGILIVDYLRK